MVVTGGGAEQAPGDLAGLVVGPWPQWAPTFRLVHQLGDRGAEGTTYQVERLRRDGTRFLPTGELVALKVFDRDAFWRDTDAGSRPLHERLHDLEDLAHLLNEVPGVVRFRSPFVGPDPLPLGHQPQDSGRLRTYLPMELVEGPTLQQVIDQTPDFGARLALLPRLRSLAETLRGFVEARPEAPVSHRDVKPANLVLTGDDRVTLVDLGLLVSPRRSVTAGLGSFGFMAPEQQESARLDPAWAHRVDWFAFYATAATLLSGEQPPWNVTGWARWLQNHPDVTPRARDVLLQAADASPRDRPAPWLWLPRLQAACGDARRAPLASTLRRHRRLAFATGSALVIGLAGMTLGSETLRGGASPSAHAPKTVLSHQAVWPLRPGCDNSTSVGMPAGLGGRAAFSPPDPRPAMVAGGGVAWRSGRLTVTLSNPTKVPALLVDLSPHLVNAQLDSPVWVFRPSPQESGCNTAAVTRRYLLDMDNMRTFAADSYPAHGLGALGLPLAIPSGGKVTLAFDVAACRGNYTFSLRAKLVPEGGDAVVLGLGDYRIAGRTEQTDVYTGDGAASSSVPSCTKLA